MGNWGFSAHSITDSLCSPDSAKQVVVSSGLSLEDTKPIQVGSKSPACIVMSQTRLWSQTCNQNLKHLQFYHMCLRYRWHKAEGGKGFLQPLLRCLVLSSHALLREKELPLTSLWCSLPICETKTVLALKEYKEA